MHINVTKLKCILKDTKAINSKSISLVGAKFVVFSYFFFLRSENVSYYAQSVSRLILLDARPLFCAFYSFFPLLFRIDFWLRLLHQNYTRVTYIKSWGTQEPSGEVSHNVAVPVVDLHVSEVSGLFIWFLGCFLLISGGLERGPKHKIWRNMKAGFLN